LSVQIDGQKYYRTGEACRLAGTSRMTFLRWVRQEKFEDVPYRDLNGWRLFSEKEINQLKSRINKLQTHTEP
jgi:hypothetical protein